MTREDMDANLASIAEHQREIDRIEAELNEGIDNLKAAAAQAARKHLAAVEEVTAAMKAAALADRKELFGEAKSLSLAHGEVGFRASTSLCLATRTATWEGVLEELTETGRVEAVRVTREINKDVLKTWPPASLAAYGVKLKSTERFFVRPDVERIRE
jgi:phage host-nuclease inhibitor protein Gam